MMSDQTTISQVYEAINLMPALLSEKGKVEPTATVLIAANAQVSILLGWRRPYAESWQTDSACFHGDTFDEIHEKAIEYIIELPSAEQAKLHRFMGELGKVIDGGRDAGIDIDFMNPLLDTMKRLSENVITHQRVKA
jgi:hypothetical protein